MTGATLVRLFSGLTNVAPPVCSFFSKWLRCRGNMAVGRQTRTLGLGITGTLATSICVSKDNLRKTLNSTPFGDGSRTNNQNNCAYRLALWTLQNSVHFFGLSEERCLSERLFARMFQVNFTRGFGIATEPMEGKGLHRVPQLQFENLSLTDQHLLLVRNRHDIKLYRAAHAIFYDQVRAFNISRKGCFRR